MDSRSYDLPEARALWSRMRRIGLAALVIPASIMLVGAVLTLLYSHGALTFREQVAALFAGTGAFFAVYWWTPLIPATSKRSPNRLVIDDAGLRMELVEGPAEAIGWTDPGFRVTLWKWPPSRSGRARFTVDIGRYSAVPINPEVEGAVRGVLQVRKCRSRETTFKLPFGRGTVLATTYGPPFDRPLSEAVSA